MDFLMLAVKWLSIGTVAVLTLIWAILDVYLLGCIIVVFFKIVRDELSDD